MYIKLYVRVCCWCQSHPVRLGRGFWLAICPVRLGRGLASYMSTGPLGAQARSQHRSEVCEETIDMSQ